MAAMAQIGAQIQKNSDGSVNTLKTLESIAKIFPTLRPEQQKSAADALGLTPELLALMRDGERMKKLLAKSDEFGLTVDPALNQQLSEVNGTMNELSASWDGLWQRSKTRHLRPFSRMVQSKTASKVLPICSPMVILRAVSCSRFYQQQ
jgi:hypothetical protein